MQVKETVDFIVNWLKNYIVESKQKGFVVGVSGGIDSAVTSALVAKTGLPVLCIEMPIHQHPSQVSRASNHIKKLQEQYSNVSTISVELTKVFDHFVNSLPDDKSHPSQEMALVNSRARLRMTSLYYFAGLYSYIVAGTGNKVEDFGVGFFTKYGDGGVDISPIADLVKSEVYALGEVLGINEDIMNAPPTDGLWGDDRTDEDQIGASYEELEWAMQQKEAGKSSLDFSGRQKEVLDIFTRFNNANKHKMQPIPVCEIPVYLKQ